MVASPGGGSVLDFGSQIEEATKGNDSTAPSSTGGPQGVTPGPVLRKRKKKNPTERLLSFKQGL
jgi:hypothetical protein